MLNAEHIKADIDRQVERLFTTKSAIIRTVTTETERKFRVGVACIKCEASLELELPKSVDSDDWADFEYSISNLFFAHHQQEHGDFDQS